MLSNNPASMSSKSEKELKVPQSLLCPITRQILRYPVTLFPSGIVIEQQAADKIILENPTCPITRKPIQAYASAFKVEEMIEEFLQKYPEAKKEQYVPLEPFTKLLEKKVENKPKIKNSPTLPRDQIIERYFDPPDFPMIFGLPAVQVEYKQQNSVSSALRRRANAQVPLSVDLTAPPPLPEIKPLYGEKKILRNQLIDNIKNIIWALQFESGPQPRARIQNFSLLIFAMMERREPLPWQKIKVSDGPKNSSMYEILKSAVKALQQLDPDILENAKNQFATQYDQVQTKLAGIKSIGKSNYVILAKTLGTISNQPGLLVSNMIKEVEKHLQSLCEPEREVSIRLA